MADKDWDDIPYVTGDCVRDVDEWNDMVDYIRHSACTDFTIYETCPLTGQAFRFTKDGDDSKLYGGDDSGDDLLVYANDSNAYPFIGLYGDSDIWLDSADDIFFKIQGTQMAKMSYSGNVTTIEGGSVAGDDLTLKSNTTDTYPAITLTGNTIIDYSAKTDHVFNVDGAQAFKMEYDGVDTTTIIGGANTGDDILYKANSTDNYSTIEMNGNSNIVYSSHGNHSFRYDATSMFVVSYAANVTTLEGGSVSGDDLIIKANTSNSYPFIKLNGADDCHFRMPNTKAFVLYNESTKMWQVDYTAGLTKQYGCGTADYDMSIYANSSDSFPIIHLDGGNENIQINDSTALSAHFDLALLGDGVLCIKETSTPTADTNYGKIYCKNDNKLYFQDGAGVEHEIDFV